MIFGKKKKEMSMQTLFSVPDDSIDQSFIVDDSDYNGGIADLPYENIIDGNYGSARRQIVKMLYDAYHNDIENYEPEYNLFQFSKYDSDYTATNLKNSVVIANPPDSFNDPLDPIIVPWLKMYRKNIKGNSVHTFAGNVQKAVEHYRIRCFAYDNGLKERGDNLILPINQNIENISPLLWAHYADGHKGICVKCKIKMEDLVRQYNTDNSYIQLRPIKYVKKLDIHQPITLSDALVMKGEYWKYENELRLIYYSTQNQQKHFPIKVDITDVYLGLLSEDKIRQEIQKAIKYSKVKLHKMIINPQDVTKLMVIDI